MTRLTSAAEKTSKCSTEASASSAAERNAGVICAAQQAGLHRDAHLADRGLVARRPNRKGVSALR